MNYLFLLFLFSLYTNYPHLLFKMINKRKNVIRRYDVIYADPPYISLHSFLTKSSSCRLRVILGVINLLLIQYQRYSSSNSLNRYISLYFTS